MKYCMRFWLMKSEFEWDLHLISRWEKIIWTTLTLIGPQIEIKSRLAKLKKNLQNPKVGRFSIGSSQKK